MNPHFLLVRYAPGSAGKMFIGLLGMHPDIANWNIDGIPQLHWFQQHFQKDFGKWLYNEPQNPWHLQKYVSAVYSRGDDLQTLPIDLPKNIWLPTVWQKNYTARFMKKTFAINIHIDQPSTKWYHKTRWKKQFSCKRMSDGYLITQHQHRPSYQIKNFNNKYKIEVENLYTFIKNEIIEYDLKKQFLEENIVNLLPGYNLSLSDLLNWQKCHAHLHNIQQTLCLKEYNWSSAKPCWKYWRNLHDY